MNIVARLKSLTLLKNASIYTGSNILSALVPFFCMPILTRYLEPSDYGIVAMMGSIISFMTPFVGLNIDGAIAANYYHKGEDFCRFVKNCNTILLISTIVVFVLVCSFSNKISSYTLFPKDWLWIVVVICVGQFIYNIHMTILQMRQRVFSYGISKILNAIFNSSMSIFLVVVLCMNWQGRVIAQVLTVVIFLLASLYYFHKFDLLGMRFDRRYIKKILKFGVPLIPHVVGGSLLTMVDRFYIAKFVDLETAGLFVVGAQIGSGMELLVASFNKAYVPWLFKNLNNINTEIRYKIVRYTYCYFVLILIIAGVYSVVMPYFLAFFLGDKFQGASSYVCAFSFGAAFTGMYYMVVNYIFYCGKTVNLMIRTMGVGIIHTFVSYFFTKAYGAYGASVCVVLSHIITFLVVWNLSSKVYSMPWFEIQKKD